MALPTCGTTALSWELLLCPGLPRASSAFLSIHTWGVQGIFSEEAPEDPGKINVPNYPNINTPNYSNINISKAIYKEKNVQIHFFSIRELFHGLKQLNLHSKN